MFIKGITGSEDAPDTQTISLPVTPVIPAQVAPGETILSSHENQVTKALSDLWTDVQTLGAVAVPSTRKITVNTPLTGGGTLAADVVINLDTSGLVPTSRRVIAGTGLSGGGDLTADRTFTVNVAAITAGIQTPWLQDISGGGHSLSTVQNITASGQIICTSFGVGTAATPSSPVNVLSLCTSNTFYANGDAVSVYVQDSGGAVNNGGHILFGAAQGSFASIKALLANGTGPRGDLIFCTRNTTGNIVERLRVSGSGNIGIGIANPAASLEIASVSGVSAIKAHSVELQSIAVNNSYLSENTYYNGSVFAYRAAGFATSLRMFNGGFDFFTAPSGPAGGAFNFPTPALTILNNGFVGIGTGSPVTALTIEGTAPVLQIRSGGYLMMRPADNSYDMRLQSTGQQLNVVAGGALSNPIASFLSNGCVGIRTALPRSPLSITAAVNPNTLATANQFTICEVSNNANYAMSVGYFADATDTKWKGVIQSMDSGGGSALLLNPSGGNVSIGAAIQPAYLLTVAGPNPASAATATQIVIKDANNTGGYSMAVGYYVQSGATWTGCIQATAISAGASLVLNPLGGNVGVGTATPVAKLHVGGTIPALPVNTSNLAGSLLLDDSSTAVGAGGMLAFSAAGTVWRFAAIKGYITNATANTQGDIVFYVRPIQSDATLSEGVRITQSAVLIVQNGLSIQNLPTGSPGAGSKQFWYDTATGIVHYAA